MTGKIYTVLDEALSLYSFPERPFSSHRYFTYLNFTERINRETTTLLSTLADRQTNGRMVILRWRLFFVKYRKGLDSSN